ncbi:GtrA family protein [Brochothrix campestris]|uniref:Cell wall teichoic acid glycosylation protein n=2 Tax=Brochothrix campestris TaxID=2757 RepID=W7CX76_9LIST|nr:cell wall teichoic acid glycosylation protein [Brochothrix campestris FSL F6-1037]
MVKLFQKELILYVLMGGVTTLVNLSVFYLMDETTVLNVSWSVTIANVCALLFAYVSNKYWVFRSHNKTRQATVIEAMSFVSVRLASLLIDIVVTFGCIHLGMPTLVAKIAANVVVIAVNYVASKWFVFK